MSQNNRRGSASSSKSTGGGGAYAPPVSTAESDFDFCNAFWVFPGMKAAQGEGDKGDWGKEGYEVVLQRMRTGTKTMDDLRQMFKDRSVRCLLLGQGSGAVREVGRCAQGVRLSPASAEEVRPDDRPIARTMAATLSGACLRAGQPARAHAVRRRAHSLRWATIVPRSVAVACARLGRSTGAHAAPSRPVALSSNSDKSARTATQPNKPPSPAKPTKAPAAN